MSRKRRVDKDQSPPESSDSLAAGLETGRDDQAVSLPSRIARYGRARHRAVMMKDYLAAQLDDQTAQAAAGRLLSCGDYLHFRHYYTVEQVQLHSAQFCKQHLICPLCAIRRGSKTLEAYLERFNVIQAERPELQPYLVTFTVRDGPDLAERFNHLQRSFKRLQDQRRRWISGSRSAPWTEFVHVAGAVSSYEVKRGAGSGLWHPHLHMVALCASPPNQAALRKEWEAITNDSFMLDVRPFRAGQDPAEGFMEVMKYAVKFSSLTLADNWQVAKLLRGCRLLFSLGVFRGVEVPDKLTDDPLDDLPYFDLFYRYVGFGYYVLTGELPP